METRPAHESSLYHLRNLVTTALGYHRENQTPLSKMYSFCIFNHVQLMCATTFSQEALVPLLIAVGKLIESNSLCESQEKQKLFDVAESLLLLQGNLVIRLREKARTTPLKQTNELEVPLQQN